MSSKFVAEGAQIQPLSQADEWAKAREKIENARKSKTEDKTGTQEGGKSLYEHLQEQRGKSLVYSATQETDAVVGSCQTGSI